MKRILIVSKTPTHPTTAGNQYWMLSQAELLKSMGHEVHFLYAYEKPLHKADRELDTVGESKRYWGVNYHQHTVSFVEKVYKAILYRIRKYFFSDFRKCDDDYPFGLHRTINKLDAEYHFDCCIVQYYFLTKAFEKIKIPKKVLATHDSFIYRKLALGGPYYSLTPNSEAKALQRSPYILSLQDNESILFKKLSPKSRVYTVYGVFDYHETPVVNNRNLLFLSGIYIYNVYGLKWFLDSVFPSIVEAFPDVKLIIGGGICRVLKEYSSLPNVSMVGYVDSPEEFFKLGDVSINPCSLGTGLKIKTFESLSYGKVVMAHPHSTEGVYSGVPVPLFSSDSPKEWVAFLQKIWITDKYLVDDYKAKTRIYIDSLKEFVAKQYERIIEG